jgi:hypothetical protein
VRRGTSHAYILAILVVAVIIVLGAVATVLQNRSTTTPITTTNTSRGTIITSQLSNPNDTTSSSNSATSSQCSEPCALWTRVLGSEVYSEAISNDDSAVAVGTGHGQTSGSIVLFNDQGAVLWNHTVDYIVASVSVSPDGSYIAAGGYQEAGPSGAYTNGTVLLFDKVGNLLWNVTGGDPVDKVQFSASASNLAVWSEYSISDLSITGSQVWNYTTPTGYFSGMDMAASGNYVVASVSYLGALPNIYGYAWSFLAFDGQGRLLWNHTATDGNQEEPGFMTTSFNGSYVWASSNWGASKGSLYLFNQQGNLLWKQQIYSPALSIQIASNLNANVWTNWGNLVYDVTGALLKNITSSSSAETGAIMSSTSSASGVSCSPPSFFTGPARGTILFLDSYGNTVSTYSSPGGFPYITLSSDHLYSVVATGYQNSSMPAAAYSFVLLSLGHGGQSCK